MQLDIPTHHLPTWTPRPPSTDVLRQAIERQYRRAESEVIAPLLTLARLPDDAAADANQLALKLARDLRNRERASGKAGLVQGLLQEFSLSSHEGIALMCLAEALLRIPDQATRDALIRDKVHQGEWATHLGKSPSLFVNAATWGLVVTGKLMAPAHEGEMLSTLTHLIGKGGEPLIRKSVDMALRMMGEQFVTGETIQGALKHASALEADGFRYSYDMLGEAALTASDAQRYCTAYENAIEAIGKASKGRGIYQGPGISIKLSALHPRYQRAQWGRVMQELYPRLLKLAGMACQYDIGLNIDAEESDRLDLSLDLLERLCHEPALAGWNGIGFVVQAYQKRCPQVIDYLIHLAQRSQHRLMVRLVKGAYWDSEIKRAQVDGLADYPVYTRKVHTDVCYVACARKLLAAPHAVYPQFATHNAETLATIYYLADPKQYTPQQYEFQCLHGMGEALYEQVVGSEKSGKLARTCRIYAPVGTHETLLAYLVRRLLENGANTSFVNRISDDTIPLETLVRSPVQAMDQTAKIEGTIGLPHPQIDVPPHLFGTQPSGAKRINSLGMDVSDENVLHRIGLTLQANTRCVWQSMPMLEHTTNSPPKPPLPVVNPAHTTEVVGYAQDATAVDVQSALQSAADAASQWAQIPPSERAAALLRAGDLMEQRMPELLALIMREAGKTLPNAIAELREAVDFLRYYAHHVASHFDNASYRPLGPVVCISPWNFPLAIFTGQVAAALAAGNTVLAKPSEQTPLIAAQAVHILWQAGIPRGALQLLPGDGSTVGAQLVADARVMGVVFTGSTEVARLIQATLAKRLTPAGQPITLIAETGGQNAMLVDSSALVEQVVADVVASAFDSAGQRCSALRVLCIQSDAADRIIDMLKGAMCELHVGNPCALDVDVGPVIDADAQKNIQAHIQTMRAQGHHVFQAPHSNPSQGNNDGLEAGTFVPPTLIEIDHISQLTREVFGPVLHVLRYARKDLRKMIDQVNQTGYGLTMGLHTRIDDTMVQVANHGHAGNLYVNRNMVGAVVGVQPFGGEGLSGTGPKAGGPMYLLRLLASHPETAYAIAVKDTTDANLPTVKVPLPHHQTPTPQAAPLPALALWAETAGHSAIAQACHRWNTQRQAGITYTLPGPTGERNTYTLSPRGRIACLANHAIDALAQLAAVLATGCKAVWPHSQMPLHALLPTPVQAHISIENIDLRNSEFPIDVVLHHGSPEALTAVCQQLAQRSGAIVNVVGLSPGSLAIPLERLLAERVLTVNTAAAGGNASLMTMSDAGVHEDESLPPSTP